MTDAADNRVNLAMTPKAAEAFAAYVAMPPKRSYRKLAESLMQQGRYKTATGALRTIAKWAVDYAWQDRLASAVTDLTRRRLEAAQELDSDTNLIISQEYNRRVRDGLAETWHADDLHPIRDRVKPALPKTEVAGTVNVKHDHDHKHSGVVEHAHHDLSHLSDEQIERAIAARRMYDEAVAPGKPDGPA